MHAASPPLTIALVANEPSGDLLGAALARAIRTQRPEVRFIGVAGPCMRAEGCESLFEMERLSVMGLTEVLAHLPALLALRRQLLASLSAEHPSLVVGIDAPDFNLGLERRLRARGIPSVHLVCPSVWAWRSGRVRTIRRSVDRLLCLFPFEEPFLQAHGVPARYVGHPLADEIPLEVDQAAARTALGLASEGAVLAVLPGSRRGEVSRLIAPFLESARRCWQARPELRILIPAVNARLRALIETAWRERAPDLPLTLVDGRSREVLAAADVVLTASGTATLEALLLKRPMVVGYRLHPLTWSLLKGWVKVPHVALSNLLVGRELAPECLQHRCHPDQLTPALLELFDNAPRLAEIRAEYRRIHESLRHDAARTAAREVLALLDGEASGD
ncbi:MAG: lipid-A-disaccharide synthase [Chromatiaceae bacterium]|nr:lipid-A-disaccharide synthase [Chromatiaceae bacterium]